MKWLFRQDRVNWNHIEKIEGIHLLTPLGKYCWKLRVNHDCILKDMSDALHVSVSYLSSVEHGKQSVPGSWERMISDAYDLNDEQRRELKDALNLLEK